VILDFFMEQLLKSTPNNDVSYLGHSVKAKKKQIPRSARDDRRARKGQRDQAAGGAR